MAEFYAGGIVYTIKVDDQTGVGVEKATRKIRDLGVEGDRADVKLKSLSRDTSILGGSLASLGGMAMVAGTAIGGPLGSNLQSAGMGVAFVGTGLATVTPALRGLSVMIDGTVIPSLIRLNAFLGPTGWIVIGVGLAAAAAATLAYKLQDTSKEFDIQRTAVDLNISSLQTLKGLYDDVKDAQDRLAGLPKKKEELELELKGAQIREGRAQERLRDVLKTEDATPLDIEEAQYSLASAQNRIRDITEQLQGIPAEIADATIKANEAIAEANRESMMFRERREGAISQPGGDITGLLGLQAMARDFHEAQKYAGSYDRIAPINQTNTINITVASVPEAKMAADMYTDSRLTRLASAQGYPNAG